MNNDHPTNPTPRLNGKLLFAIPKKGRLKEKALSLLDGSDVQFNRSDRSDIAFSNNTPVALVFLPASDIPAFVGRGKGALGITGSDCILEYESKEPPTATSGVEQILDLGFGRCKLQVQVPEKGEVERPEQLVGKTIATSFDGLSRKYFRELERKVGGGEQVNGSEEGGEGKLQTNILHLSGSVEAAYSLGMADAVVDLVGTYPQKLTLTHGVANVNEPRLIAFPSRIRPNHARRGPETHRHRPRVLRRSNPL